MTIDGWFFVNLGVCIGSVMLAGYYLGDLYARKKRW